MLQWVVKLTACKKHPSFRRKPYETKDGNPNIRSVAPSTVQFKEESPLFSMVQSLANEINQLGIKSMRTKEYSSRK